MNRFKYWIKVSLKDLSIIVLGSIAYALFMSIVDEDPMSLIEFSKIMVYFFSIIWFFFAFITSVTRFVLLTNVAISMGETRKNVALGIHLYNLTQFIFAFLILNIVAFITDYSSIKLVTVLTSIPATYLFSCGVGLIIYSNSKTDITTKSVPAIILMFVAIIVIFSSCFLTGIANLSSGELFPEGSIVPTVATCIIAALGILAYFIGTILTRKRLCKYEACL